MKVTSARTVQGKMDDAKFSTAIDAAGHGRFQYMAFLTAGLIYFTCGLQSGVNAYILPSVKCAFQLTDSQMGILNALFLGGGCISAHIWGALSDSYGRRPVLAGAALLDAVCIVFSAFAPSYEVFAFLRLLSGMLNMAPAGLTFLYLGEFVGDRRRTAFSQAMGTTWILSWIILPGLAYVVIPMPWSLDVLGVRLQSWRLFLLMLLVPTTTALCLGLYMPETPKFLQSAGREEDALRVYRRIYALNTGDSADNYPVKRLHLPGALGAKGRSVATGAPTTAVSANGHGQGVLQILARTLRLSLELFRPPVLYRTLLCCLIYFCSIFVMYGFGLWLPELLNRFELHARDHPGEREYVCTVLTTVNNATTSSQGDAGMSCGDASVVDPSAFLNTATVNGACMVFNLISTFITGYIGRRTLSAGCNLLAGLTGFALLYASSTMEVVIVSVFFTALAETGCIGINGMIVDVFPPRVSGVGVASVMLSGRLGGSIGNLVMGYLLEQSCELPLLLLFGTGVACGVLCCCAHRRYADDDDGDKDKGAGRTVMVAVVDSTGKESVIGKMNSTSPTTPEFA